MHLSIKGIWTTPEVIVIRIVVVVEVTITIYVPYIVSIINRAEYPDQLQTKPK